MSDTRNPPLDLALLEGMSTMMNMPSASHLIDVKEFAANTPSFLLPERPKKLAMDSEKEHPQIAEAEEDDIEEVEEDGLIDGSEDVDQAKDVAHAQTAPTAKKRKQDSDFEEWLEKNQREVNAASKVELTNRLDKVSISRLLEDSSKQKIITSPREYQIDLYERAKEENTIVVLDTGMMMLYLSMRSAFVTNVL
jgi:endoribonuclease Dicer